MPTPGMHPGNGSDITDRHRVNDGTGEQTIAPRGAILHLPRTQVTTETHDRGKLDDLHSPRQHKFGQLRSTAPKPRERRQIL